MTSWIDSAVTPTTEAIRFEGDDTQEAWPPGAYVHIKSRVNSGDDKSLKQHVYEMRKQPDGTSELEYLWYLGQLGQCAQFIVKVEGDCFNDPDTGEPLDFAGGWDSRLRSAERLPIPVRVFVSAEVDKRSEDPLGLKRNDNDGSTKPSRSSRSQKDHLKLAK